MAIVKRDKNEVAVVEKNEVATVGEISPLALMTMAMDKNLDLDRIERLLKFQVEAEDRQAQKKYTKAIVKFKQEKIVISKDRAVGYKNKDGTFTGYKHASLGHVATIIGAGLAKYGVSADWDIEQNAGNITVTCTVTHSRGGSKSVTMTAPPDNTGKKNTIQQTSSTVTYLQRYTLLAVTGIATSDCDDDGAGYSKPVKTITEKQCSTIVDLLTATESDVTIFLKWVGVEQIEDIPESRYNNTVGTLERKLETKRGKK